MQQLDKQRENRAVEKHFRTEEIAAHHAMGSVVAIWINLHTAEGKI